jgi:hypothetical protein
LHGNFAGVLPHLFASVALASIPVRAEDIDGVAWGVQPQAPHPCKTFMWRYRPVHFDRSPDGRQQFHGASLTALK